VVALTGASSGARCLLDRDRCRSADEVLSEAPAPTLMQVNAGDGDETEFK